MQTSDTSVCWGIDLGGTKIEGLVATWPDYRPLARLRRPTEQQWGYAHILSQIAGIVDDLKSATGLTPARIGIGTPGALDPDSQSIKNSNTTCLIGQPLRRDLEQMLGVGIHMANDANCFVLAEARLGAAAAAAPGAESVFGIIMGTGVGGGLVVHGQVLHGRQGIAGEWGHNYLDASGGPCYCGRTGCVETILAGPALERYYLTQSGTSRSLPEIYARHQTGTDPAATDTIRRLLYFFGRGVASVINILDPEVVIVGGGVGNIDLLYTAGVQEVARHVFNPVLHTRILRPSLGDSAGVFGAAMLTTS